MTIFLEELGSVPVIKIPPLRENHLNRVALAQLWHSSLLRKALVSTNELCYATQGGCGGGMPWS
jgi:hypothetical protein